MSVHTRIFGVNPVLYVVITAEKSRIVDDCTCFRFTFSVFWVSAQNNALIYRDKAS